MNSSDWAIALTSNWDIIGLLITNVIALFAPSPKLKK